MKLLGNILWHFPFFGFITAGLTWLLGLILTITIIFAPIGRGLMSLGVFLLKPFGSVMVDQKDLGEKVDVFTGSYGFILQLLYIVFIQAVLLLLSIIGIPAGLVILKSLGAYFNPVGKRAVAMASYHETVVKNLAQAD